MAFDAHKNLAISTITFIESPPTSGVNILVTAGEGARFPAVPFNVTIWPANQPPTPANAEIARVVALSGDALGLVRAVEGSAARAIVIGDLIAATITAKALTDVESGTNFPLVTTPGAVTAGGHVVTGTLRGALNTGVLTLSGGPDIGTSAYVNLYGSAFPSGFAGGVDLVAPGIGGFSIGTLHPAGTIKFLTNSVERGRVHASGGFSWGGTLDPGAGTVHLTAAAASVPNLICLGPGVGQNFPVTFQNANGQVGYIGTLGNATTYTTTSDQRLKTDRGLITDPEVLRATRVHHFTWTTDGTVGRGVFAQEALAVLPAAVSIGTDDRDDAGRLTHPWGVDYSKYVPDLIAGWQHHDRQFDAMAQRVEFLEKRYQETMVAQLRAAHTRPSLFNRVRTMLRAFGQWWKPSWV